MRGILMLTRAEIHRLRRNKRYLLFTIGLPVILYLLIAKQGKSAYGVDFAAYYMVAMATFGSFSGALNGNAIRISEERKVGWIRQLRLTPLPANAYVIAQGGPVEPVHALGRRAPVLLLSTDEEAPTVHAEMDRFGSELASDGWSFVQEERSGGHELNDQDVDAALDFFDEPSHDALH